MVSDAQYKKYSNKKGLTIFIIGTMIILGGLFYIISNPSSVSFLTYTGDSAELDPNRAEVSQQISLSDQINEASLQGSSSPITLTNQDIKTKEVKTDNYYIHKKTGNESFFDVGFEEVFITTEELFEGELINVTKKYINISFTADFESKALDNESKATYEVPTTFNLYKDQEKTVSKKTTLTRKLKEKDGKKAKDKSKFKEGDKYTFSYLADPTNETYLKFGENSIELTTSILITEVLLEQSVAQPWYIHQNVSDSDLLLYMTFDHDNSTNIYDYSNKNNNAITSLSARPNATGLYGNALDVSGAGSGLNFTDIDAMEGIPELTMTLWMYSRDVSTGFQGIFLKRNSASGLNSIEILHGGSGAGDADDLFFRVNSGSDANGYSTSNVLTTNSWQMVTMVYNGSLADANARVKGYVDGVELSLTRTGTPPTTTPSGTGIVQIGNVVNIVKNGLFDDVRIYTRALSDAEILEIYVNESALFENNPSNFTLPTLNATLTTETKLNVSFRDYERLQGTNVSVDVAEWNFTDNYDDLEEGLVGAWHFDNRTDLGENTTKFIDSSQYGVNVSLSGGDGDEVAEAGKYHSAFESDATSDILRNSSQVPNAYPTGVNNMTFSFWQNGAFAANLRIVNYGGSSDNTRMMIGSWGNIANQFSVVWASSTGCGSGVQPFDSTWHHLTVGLNSTSVLLFVDGELEKVCSRASLSFTSNAINFNDVPLGNDFNGKIDEMRVYNRTLTNNEVKELYIKGKLNYKPIGRQNLTDFNTTDSINTFDVKSSSTQFSVIPALEPNHNDSYSALFDVGSDIDYTFFDTVPPVVPGQGTKAEPLYVHQNVTDTDLVMYMSFDHDNSTNVYDYTNYDNDGTTSGNANPNATGLYGKAIDFDGTGDYVTVTNDPTIQTGPMTYSMWVNYRSLSNNTVFSWKVNDYGLVYGNYGSIGCTAGQLCFATRDISGVAWNVVSGTSVPSSNTWVHLVGVNNNTDNLIYINGVEDNTATSDLILHSSNNLIFGGDGASTNMDGLIDEVKLYNSSLSAEQVLEIYNNESSIFGEQANYTIVSFNETLTTENQVNVSFNFYERLQGTNLSQIFGEWNYTDNYDESDPDLMFDMHFDNRTDLGENDTYFLDSSSYGINGTLDGNGIVNVAGKYHTGITFDGTTDAVLLGSPASLQIEIITISTWFKLNGDYISTQAIVGNYEDNNPGGDNSKYSLVYGRTDNKFDFYCGTESPGYCAVSTGSISDDDWHHITATRTGSTNNWEVKFYIDGVLDSTTSSITVDPNVGTYPTSIGKFGDFSGSTFNGQLDDVKIYNRSLTAQEVSELYLKGNLNFKYSDPQNFSDLNTTTSLNNFSVVSSSTQFHSQVTFEVNANNSYSALLDVPSTIDYTFFSNAGGGAIECGNLTSDITLTQNVSSDATCFEIQANDVDIYCEGFTISYASDFGGNGILDNGGHNGTTINNCNIFADNSLNSNEPIKLVNSGSVNITGNNLSMDSTISAFPIIYLSGTNNVRINNNNISQQAMYQAIDIGGSTGTKIESNLIEVTDTTGKAVYGSGIATNTVLENNTVFTNGHGFFFENGASYPSLINISSNNFSGLQEGFNIRIGSYLDQPNILRNQVHNIGNFSLDTYLIVEDTTFGEVKWFDTATINVITLTGTNLSTLITFGNASIFVDDSVGIGALNKSANLSMYNSPSAGITEPLIFRNGVYCPTEECFNFTAMESATLIFNSTSAGNFTIQSNVSSDTTPPNVTGLSVSPASPVTYSPTAIEYNFTANITDETSLSTVLFEFEGVNYTGTNTVESRYNLTVSKMLGVGTYNIRISATDTAGNVNNTEVIALVVNQATPEVNLTLDTLDQDISINQGASVNITGFEITGDAEFIYTREDGSLINNGTSPISNVTTYNEVGTFFINVTYPQSQNYTTISESHVLTVNDTTPPNVTNLAVQPSSPVTYVAGAEYNFTANVTDNVLLDTVLIELLGVNYTATNNLESNYNLTFFDLPAGTHTARFSANDSSGNVNNTETLSIVVNQATVNSALRLNTSEANYTANYPETVNASATSSTSQATITLLRDGVDITSAENHKNISLAPGTYNYTALIIGDQNFTNATINRFAVINLGVSEVNLTLNGTDGNLNIATGELVNSTGFLITGDGESIFITIDGDLIVNGTSPVGNITNHSTVGVFTYNVTYQQSENYSTSSETHTVTVANLPDTLFPDVTSLTESPLSPQTYVAGARYEFNATITDETALDTVRLEFNGTTFPAQNITATGVSGIFNVSVYDLGAGTYSYRWFANDTSGNVNDTETGFYTIIVANGTVSTFLDGVSSDKTVNNNTNVNMSGQLDAGVGEISLFQDGGLINTDTNFISNVSLFDVVGTFIINTSYAGNENFTATSEAFTLTIQAPSIASGLNGEDMIFGYDIQNIIELKLNTLRFGYTT